MLKHGKRLLWSCVWSIQNKKISNGTHHEKSENKLNLVSPINPFPPFNGWAKSLNMPQQAKSESPPLLPFASFFFSWVKPSKAKFPIKKPNHQGKNYSGQVESLFVVFSSFFFLNIFFSKIQDSLVLKNVFYNITWITYSVFRKNIFQKTLT